MTTQPMQSIGELLEAYQRVIARAEAAEAKLAICVEALEGLCNDQDVPYGIREIASEALERINHLSPKE